MENIVSRLKDFIENEARSCSMDFGCITPLYVYRMWGGDVPLEEIETAFKEVDILNGRRLNNHQIECGYGANCCNCSKCC